MALNTSRSATGRLLKQWSSQSTIPLLASSKPAAYAAPFSTSSTRQSAETAGGQNSAPTEDLPRWAQTPPRMKAPFSPHITKDPSRSKWTVNSDPKRLDEAMDNFLGRDGHRLLPEELKWLSITHKSFDQGRRGFNDRLAYLGRHICIQEVTEAILQPGSAFVPESLSPKKDDGQGDQFAGRREPFEDTTLRGLGNLSTVQPADVFTIEKVAKVAVLSGIPEIVRWKPRLVRTGPYTWQQPSSKKQTRQQVLWSTWNT